MDKISKESSGRCKGEKIFEVFVYSDKNAGPKAKEWKGIKNVVRIAQCEIPDSELAKTMLDKQLVKFGKGTFLETKKESATEKKKGDWYCSEYQTTYKCQYDPVNDVILADTCEPNGVVCKTYVYIEDSNTGGGNGSIGDPSELPGDCSGGLSPCVGSGGGIDLNNPPEGIPSDLYDRLNAEEKRLCWENVSQCYNAIKAAEFAQEWAADIEPNGPHNGPQDALRHATWSAKMTLEMGQAVAKKWGDAHEWDSVSPQETAMDLFNNEKGRIIGSYSGYLHRMLELLIQALRDGTLCTEVGTC